MIRRTALPLAALALIAQAPAPAPTRLMLSATGEASATPDLLDASLTAQTSGTDPARVQQSVDRAARQGADLARAVPGVQPSLENFSTAEDDKHVWTATATLALEGSDGAALLALVGKLQQSGLALTSLEWRMSTMTRTTAVNTAEREAINALRTRARNAADALGFNVAGIAELRLDEDGGRFHPMPMAMGAMAMRTASPPNLQTAQRVNATASATFLLAPK